MTAFERNPRDKPRDLELPDIFKPTMSRPCEWSTVQSSPSLIDNTSEPDTLVRALFPSLLRKMPSFQFISENAGISVKGLDIPKAFLRFSKDPRFRRTLAVVKILHDTIAGIFTKISAHIVSDLDNALPSALAIAKIEAEEAHEELDHFRQHFEAVARGISANPTPGVSVEEEIRVHTAPIRVARSHAERAYRAKERKVKHLTTVISKLKFAATNAIFHRLWLDRIYWLIKQITYRAAQRSPYPMELLFPLQGSTYFFLNGLAAGAFVFRNNCAPPVFDLQFRYRYLFTFVPHALMYCPNANNKCGPLKRKRTSGSDSDDSSDLLCMQCAQHFQANIRDLMECPLQDLNGYVPAPETYLLRRW